MNKSVLVLNISIVSWKRALNLILKGRAEIVEESGQIVKNFEGTKSFILPAVIKLINYVKGVYRAKITLSRRNVIIRDKHICQYCGSKENLTVDHVTPYSAVGTSTWQNCVAACGHCNRRKGSKSLKECNLTLKSKPKEPSLAEFIKAKLDSYDIKFNF